MIAQGDRGIWFGRGIEMKRISIRFIVTYNTYIAGDIFSRCDVQYSDLI